MRTQETAILDIEQLSFSYGDALILENVNVQIRAGEFIGIFGPNGGGKTTLLKLILGLLTPEKGVIRLFGKPPEEVREKIGYVPQIMRFDRDFPISVLDVVMMGALNRLNRWGRFPKKTREKAYQALERVGMAHKASVPFGTLSGGEAQRVLMARAIVDEPLLLLLDEPTANIDPEAQQSIHELLIALNQTMTLLMVTHDLQTIVDKVGRLLCVNREVTALQTKELCEHFALGLYHTPLPSKDHFRM